MIPRLQTEYEVEDAADEDELRRIVRGAAPAPSPAPAPAPAASTTDWMSNTPTGWGGFTGEEKIQYFNQHGITPEQLAPYATPEEIQYFYDHMGYTVGKPTTAPAPTVAPAPPLTPFDVFKQDLFTTEMLPTGASPETGADQFQAGARSYQLGNQTVVPDDQGGYVVNTPTAQDGIYKAERFDASGKKIGEFINDARNTDLQDLAQLATFALGVGPLGGMLGSTVAGALGIPVATATSAGLTAAQLAALGTTVGSAGLGILQGQDPLDVLQNAIRAGATAFLPSQVSSFIPSTGIRWLTAVSELLRGRQDSHQNLLTRQLMLPSLAAIRRKYLTR